jgi:hypothetical protein
VRGAESAREFVIPDAAPRDPEWVSALSPSCGGRPFGWRRISLEPVPGSALRAAPE